MNKKKMKREDILVSIKEIEAYMALEGEVFDFGEGEMSSTSNESAYYEIELDNLYALEKELQQKTKQPIVKNKQKRNIYYRNQARKRKSLRLKRFAVSSYYIHEKFENHYVIAGGKGRYRRFLKKHSNGVIRRYKGDVQMKGRSHFKVYDFWWELY